MSDDNSIDGASDSGHKFSPVQALRLIREILSDRSMTHSERIAAAAVVFCMDNGSGTAWASYRSIREEFDVCNRRIAGALRADGGKAIGRYYRRSARGSKGSVQYAALSREERSTSQSALTTRALKGSKRSHGESAGKRSALSRGESQRSHGERHSYPKVLAPKKKGAAKKK